VTKTDVVVEMNWICALILPRCTQESVAIYGHLLVTVKAQSIGIG